MGPLHWECRILAPGPPGKSLNIYVVTCLLVSTCVFSNLGGRRCNFTNKSGRINYQYIKMTERSMKTQNQPSAHRISAGYIKRESWISISDVEGKAPILSMGSMLCVEKYPHLHAPQIWGKSITLILFL